MVSFDRINLLVWPFPNFLVVSTYNIFIKILNSKCLSLKMSFTLELIFRNVFILARTSES